MAAKTAFASRKSTAEEPVEPVLPAETPEPETDPEPAEGVPNDPETEPEDPDEEPEEDPEFPPDADDEPVPVPEEPEIPLQEVPEEELQAEKERREWAEKHAPEPRDEPLIRPNTANDRSRVKEELAKGSQTEEVEPPEEFEDVDSIPPIQQRGRKYDAAVDGAIASAASGRSGIVCLRSTPDKSVGAAAQTINKTYTTPRTSRVPGVDGHRKAYDISAVGRVDPVTGLTHVYVAAVEHVAQDSQT